jgi:proton-dependent oligopeptide transporter, POT family
VSTVQAAPVRGVTASTDRAFFGHPRGLGLLAAAEMWERFSYYGMRAILVLYLTKALGWSGQDASRLYGAYTGAVYLSPMIGGYIADRFIGTRRSLVIGGVIIAIGHFLLAVEGMTFFYAGLIAVVIGTGFFKPNVSTMVGQLYAQGDPRRDAGFTIFYSCFNFGAFLAPLICGYLAENERFGWHMGFGAAGVGMVLGLIVYLLGREKYLPGIGLAPDHARDAEIAAEAGEIGIPSYTRNAVLGATGGVIVSTLASVGTWSAIGIPAWLFSLTGLMSLLYGSIIGAAFTVALLGTKGEERNRVWALVMVSTFVVFFWLVFEQAGSSLTLFADRDTDLTRGAALFGLERFPASWFQSIQPLCIILLGPFAGWFWLFLNKRNREPATTMKMVYGLFLAGLGFFLLYFAGQAVDAGSKVSPFWLVGAYFCHSLGEIALYPVGLSYVTKVAPMQFVSLLMGTWFLAISAANFLGGFLAGLIDDIPSRATFFTIPTATAWGAGLLMLLCVPLLRRLTRSVPAA